MRRTLTKKAPFRWFHWCFGFLLLSALLYNLSLTNQVRLQIPADAAKQLARPEEYKKAADEILSSRWQYSLKPFAQASSITKQLAKSFPELAQVRLKVPLIGRQPTIVVRPARPALVVQAGNDSYIVDEYGSSLLPVSPRFHKLAATLPLLLDQAHVSLTPGQPILTAAEVTFIKTTVALLDAKGVKLAAIILPPGPADLHLQPAGQGTIIKMDMKGDARLQVGSYLAALKQGELVSGEYIDVRLPDKVYVR